MCFDNGSCIFFQKCTYNQIMQHSRIRAMGDRCPLNVPCIFHHNMFFLNSSTVRNIVPMIYLADRTVLSSSKLDSSMGLAGP